MHGDYFFSVDQPCFLGIGANRRGLRGTAGESKQSEVSSAAPKEGGPKRSKMSVAALPENQQWGADFQSDSIVKMLAFASSTLISYLLKTF